MVLARQQFAGAGIFPVFHGVAEFAGSSGVRPGKIVLKFGFPLDHPLSGRRRAK
jgi:hypothetical protein